MTILKKISKIPLTLLCKTVPNNSNRIIWDSFTVTKKIITGARSFIDVKEKSKKITKSKKQKLLTLVSAFSIGSGLLTTGQVNAFEIDCTSPVWRDSQECKNKPKKEKPKPKPIYNRGKKLDRTSPIIVMPVVDKSGHKGMQGGAFKDFATEVLNQALRNMKIKTLPWFKVSKALEQEVYGLGKMTSSSPYKMIIAPGMKQDLTSDLYINEMITSGEKLGADYIVRPVVLKLLTSSKIETKKATCLPILGCTSPAKSKLIVFGESAIKVDIISIKEQDIIASRTFNGRSVDVTKERAIRIDNVVGSEFFQSESAYSCDADIKDKDICNESKLKVAIYDTVDQIIDFVDAKVNYEIR